MVRMSKSQVSGVFRDDVIPDALNTAKELKSRLWLLHCASDAKFYFLFFSTEIPEIFRGGREPYWRNTMGESGSYYSDYYEPAQFLDLPEAVRDAFTRLEPILVVEGDDTNGWID